MHLLIKVLQKYFHTLTRYDESKPAYQSNGLKSQPLSDSKVIKITLLNPTNVIEHLDDAKFTAMVKGEYQIKKVKIKDEIKKSKNKDTISIPFTFDRSTKVGLIQPGDLFFGCITADGYSSSENSMRGQTYKTLRQIKRVTRSTNDKIKKYTFFFIIINQLFYSLSSLFFLAFKIIFIHGMKIFLFFIILIRIQMVSIHYRIQFTCRYFCQGFIYIWIHKSMWKLCMS